MILIRHSNSSPEADRDAHQWQLSPLGRQRCKLLASRLQSYDLDRLATSVEPKARQTGELTARHLGIPCEVADNLHEQQRRTAPWLDNPEAFVAAVTRIFQEPDRVVFGEESGYDCLNRFNRAIEQVLASYPGQRIGIVSHGTAMALFIAYHNQLDPIPLWRRFGMPAFVRLQLPGYRILETVNEIA